MGALGKAPDALGNGLTMTEHRRIIWTHYHTFGIIKGAEVSGTATMAYKVNAGAVSKETSASLREAIEIPVPPVTVPTIPAPATGSRKDYILVDQDGQVVVKQAPDSSMATLDVRTVNAGITATSATTGAVDRDYAVPSAGSLGVIDRWDEALGHRVAIPNGKTRLKSGRFVLPSDRRMIFDIRHSATEAGYTDPINMPMNGALTGAILYTITVDSVVYKVTFYHGKFWETRTDSVDFWATAGAHNWSIDRERWISSGTGAITLGNGSSDIPPSSIKIVDRGATR